MRSVHVLMAGTTAVMVGIKLFRWRTTSGCTSLLVCGTVFAFLFLIMIAVEWKFPLSFNTACFSCHAISLTAVLLMGVYMCSWVGFLTFSPLSVQEATNNCFDRPFAILDFAHIVVITAYLVLLLTIALSRSAEREGDRCKSWP